MFHGPHDSFLHYGYQIADDRADFGVDFFAAQRLRILDMSSVSLAHRSNSSGLASSSLTHLIACFVSSSSDTSFFSDIVCCVSPSRLINASLEVVVDGSFADDFVSSISRCFMLRFASEYFLFSPHFLDSSTEMASSEKFTPSDVHAAKSRYPVDNNLTSSTAERDVRLRSGPSESNILARLPLLGLLARQETCNLPEFCVRLLHPVARFRLSCMRGRADRVCRRKTL